ncbi:hypothetical protein ACS0TY_008295 [Phlomoides rotata]
MDGIASNSFQMKMDRSNHHRVAQVDESDAMKTMIMTLMEKFHAFSGSSSYNPNFKHHENFSYANQKAAVQFPPGFNPSAKPPNNEGRPSQDEAMEAMFKRMEEFMKNTSGQIKTLEHQMGQLASTMGEQHQKEKKGEIEEEEELELAKEDEEDKGMGTERERKEEK